MELDGVAAAAAAIVLAARRGVSRDSAAIPDALTVLRVVADGIVRAAATADEEEVLISRDMVWPGGADRSAAMALPVLLVDEELRERAGLSMRDVTEIVKGLAKSHYSEVRSRLVAALEIVWSEPCEGAAPTHDAAMAALRVLVATAGLGRWTAAGQRPREPLVEPLENTLATTELVLEPGAASDALPGLITASRLTCAHGECALQLLDALVRYDLRLWPAHFARHHYEVGGWRDIIDRVVASWILDGKPQLLIDYLNAFAPVAEELRGLLAALAAEATTPQRAMMLHHIWPDIFDALLPEPRARRANGKRDLEPPYYAVQELDAALLPMRPEDAAWRTWMPSQRASSPRCRRRWSNASQRDQMATALIAEMNVTRGTEDRCIAVRAIADNVFNAREAAGVTRKAMARTLGITTSTLWRKETGGTELKASELVEIARVCGVDVCRLLAVEA